jgi:hypothetical protein
MDNQNNELETYWCRTAALLATKFKKDYREAAQSFPPDRKIELYEHLIECLKIYESMLYDPSDESWDKYINLENVFHKKEGKRLKVYSEKDMTIYFGDVNAFVKKGVFTPEQWKSFEPEKKEFTIDWAMFFIGLCRGMLIMECKSIWLELPPEDELEQKTTTNLDPTNQQIELNGNEAKEYRIEPPIRNRSKREADDNMTKLNQEQSVLLLDYLISHRYFLNGEYLRKNLAGLGFEILTGYSKTTTRQSLSDIEKIRTRKNLKEIEDLLKSVLISIDKDWQAAKPKKTPDK